MPPMNERKQQQYVFFSVLQKKVLLPSMYLTNYSKSKNMSVGKVCIKRFEFACMTILSSETVSIVLCQCSIMNNASATCFKSAQNGCNSDPKRIQNALKTFKEATINQNFSRG